MHFNFSRLSLPFVAAVCCLSVVVLPTVGATHARSQQVHLGGSYTYSLLTNDQPSADWFSVHATHDISTSLGYTLRGAQSNQFNLQDTRYGADGYYWFHRNLGIKTGGSYSPTHRVLARTKGYGSVWAYPWRSLYTNIGASRSDYDTPVMEAVHARFGWEGTNYDLDYTATFYWLAGEGSTVGHTLHYQRYPNWEGYWSVSLSGGKQPRELTGETLSLTDYQSVSFRVSRPVGRDSPGRLIYYGMSFVRLSDAYDSVSFNIGIEWVP